MRLIRRLSLVALIGLIIQGSIQQVAAQSPKPSGPFQGKWTWAYFLKDKDLRDPDTVEIYKQLAGDIDIKAVPFMELDLDLTRKGNRLTGECLSVMRFGNRIDSSEFTSIIKGNVTQFGLKSSHGGKVTVRLTSHANRLYWRIIKADNSEGNYWYPGRAVLHRARREVAANQPRAEIEFRLAESEPAEGLTRATVEGKDEKVYLHREAIITNNDIIKACVVKDKYEGTFSIEVFITKEGAEKLARATEEHIGAKGEQLLQAIAEEGA
jgi:hypothetical protein